MSSSTGSDPAAELLGVVSLRYDLLSALAEAPAEQPALVEQLNSSKATVYRAVSELEATDLIEHGEDGYTLTVPGEVILAAYEEFRAAAEPTAAASELLRRLPKDASVPPSFLRGAEVVTGTGPASYEPGERISSLVSGSTRVRGLAKAHTQSDAVDVYNRAVVERGTDAAFVLDPEMAEHLRSLNGPKMRAVLDSEHFTVHGTSDLPFGLFVGEDPGGPARVVLGVYDDDGLLRGAVVNDTDPALEWAEETYERYRRSATERGG
jgi:predicted transcriptional regulator